MSLLARPGLSPYIHAQPTLPATARCPMLRRLVFLPLLLLAPLTALPHKADDKPADKAAPKKVTFTSDAFSGLTLRSVGPALFSGRVVGLAVHPGKRGHYYAAVGCGGVWKTTN